MLREAVEQRLQAIQADNAKQLDQMRATVDEKLQGTLEKRLGESFKQVSERLEQVSKGLGEMQSLATGVGDLKKVLTNVKTRGTWGEVQLGAMLEQVLTPDQYAANVAVKDGGERVEFAIKLPGRSEDEKEVVWLPVDAKFPVEDYQRLMDAQEKADAESAEGAAKQLETRIKQCAGDICGKYLNPPKTTDFGILFLPTEGLFAEVDPPHRPCRIRPAGMPGGDRRTDHALGAPQQPADGFPDAGDSETIRRSLEPAVGGQDGVDEIRGCSDQGAEKDPRGIRYHRTGADTNTGHRA